MSHVHQESDDEGRSERDQLIIGIGLLIWSTGGMVVVVVGVVVGGE